MTTTEDAREFARRWRVAGSALDAVKCADLRAMTDGEGQRQSALVLDLAGRWLEQNPGVTRPSGMVEQQRVFARWWKSRK